eukprot:3141_1
MASIFQTESSSNHIVAAVSIDDPFLHYSNDENRMQRLHMIESSNADVQEPSHQQDQQDHHHQRDTRISFELHPSAILKSSLDEIHEEVDSPLDTEGVDSHNGVADLLAILFQIRPDIRDCPEIVLLDAMLE